MNSIEYMGQIRMRIRLFLKLLLLKTLTLPMPKGRGFSVLPSQPCICKVLYKVPERSVRACPALP